MTIAEVKTYLVELLAAYFGDGHVFFAEHKLVQRPVPYVSLKAGNIHRSGKITVYDEDHHCFFDYMECKTNVDVNLYTAGENIAGIGQTPVYENTALSDMNGFLNYLESDAILDDMSRKDVAISVVGDIQDLAYLVNDSSYRFRAMVELEVTYTDRACGRFGQNWKVLPNSSGGGNEDMVDELETINEVEMEEKDEQRK